MNNNSLSMAVHREWATRPADQRFETLDALETSVINRRNSSYAADLDVLDVEFKAGSNGDGGIYVVSKKLAIPEAVPTHWAFGQAAALVKAPAGYLRTLPPALAVQALNYGVSQRESEGIKVLTYDDNAVDLQRLQAFTSQTYGRIWDADVVAATRRIVTADSRWFNPKEWSGKPGGLYASDHDVFLFFCDGGSIVDGGGDRDQLHRGFFVWNSEVGSAVFGLAAFLFRMVCGNYIIHGMEGVKLLRIRHTSGGPERFVNEAVPALKEYVDASAKPVEAQIKKAKALLLPAKEDEFLSFFTSKGFTKGEVKRAKTTAEQMEGQAGSLWDMVNGFTAVARELAFADARVDLSKRAGKLLELAA